MNTALYCSIHETRCVMYYGPTVVHCTVMCRTNEIMRRHEKKRKRYEGKTGADPLIGTEINEK